MKSVVRVTIISIISVLFFGNQLYAEKYVNISSHELANLMKHGIPVYDIRRAEEWKQTGVVPGSRLLTYQDANGNVVPGFFKRFTKDISNNKSVILICRTGNRTSKLAHELEVKYGYSNIYNVQKGIKQWIKDGYQTEKQ